VLIGGELILTSARSWGYLPARPRKPADDLR